jgi:[ribosomal protein S18]-alanine N-acetyltransferase
VITLSAKRVGNRLHVTIADDGAGVDLAKVREHAVRVGVLTAERAAAADDALLLSLLLRPGFSTQTAPDLLSGRGIGLDIAASGVQKLGGNVKLMSRSGQGFSVRIEVPVDAAAGGVRIERMTEVDIPNAVEIMEHSGLRDPDTQRRAASTRLREELGRPWARVRVARDPGGELLALLVAWHIADEVHVLDVVTRRSARRRGIARALMSELIGFARGLPIKHLLLEVRRGNAPAIKLYRGLGFFAMNVRKKYYDDGEDAVEMRLLLDDVTREVRLMPDEIALDGPTDNQ